MNSAVEVLGFANLFLAGILSGEELVIYYGVRTPLAGLEERPQTLLRQALIRRLRVLMPAIFVPTIFLGAAVTAVDGFGPGFVFRSVGFLALLTWAVVTIPRNSSYQCGHPRLGSQRAAQELANDGEPMGAVCRCKTLGGDGRICHVLNGHGGQFWLA